MTATTRFPFDVLASVVAAAAICAAGVIHETWFYVPLGATAMLAVVFVAIVWVRRRIWTHDRPTLVAAVCVFLAFFVAFAVVSEALAEIQHVRGFETRGSGHSTPWNIFEGRSIFRMWNRSAFPLPLPRRSPTKTLHLVTTPASFR
jgi:hypothetical protein